MLTRRQSYTDVSVLMMCRHQLTYLEVKQYGSLSVVETLTCCYSLSHRSPTRYLQTVPLSNCSRPTRVRTWQAKFMLVEPISLRTVIAIFQKSCFAVSHCVRSSLEYKRNLVTKTTQKWDYKISRPSRLWLALPLWRQHCLINWTMTVILKCGGENIDSHVINSNEGRKKVGGQMKGVIWAKYVTKIDTWNVITA